MQLHGALLYSDHEWKHNACAASILQTCDLIQSVKYVSFFRRNIRKTSEIKNTFLFSCCLFIAILCMHVHTLQT